MLTQVDVTNDRSDTLQLSLLDSSNGYVVKDIEGLDPVKATLTSSSMAQLDGAQPQNARRDIRNVTMKLGLEPDYIVSTVDSLRSGLYDYLMPKGNVGLGFYKNGILYATASGQVESFQNSMFSADPEVDISIICYDPDFSAPAPITASLHTTKLTDTTAITYQGSSDAGVIFALNVDRTATSFTLYNTTPDGTLQIMPFAGTFAAGDVVTVNTIPGQKSVTLTRAGITTSVLFYLDPVSSWIFLKRGVNQFRAYYNDVTPIPYTLTYTPLYGGL